MAKKIREFLAPRSKHNWVPLLVFSLDESHDLTTPQNGSWSFFSCLRRALRQTKGQPIFSLFLSTVGKYQDFFPETPFEKSNRIKTDALHSLPAITEVGFDMLAEPISENEKKLKDVTSIEYMAHLGRPL